MIIQLKGRIFDLQEKYKDYEILETKIKKLQFDNLELVHMKNDAEFEMKATVGHYEKVINELKEEINQLNENNNDKKRINKSLFESTLILQSDNRNLMTKVNEQTDMIYDLVNQKRQLEETVHNISKSMLEIKEENTRLLNREDRNILTNRSYQYSSRGFKEEEDNKNRLLEENMKLKQHILIVMNQNQTLTREMEEIIVKQSNYERLNQVVHLNKKVLGESLEKMEDAMKIRTFGNYYDDDQHDKVPQNDRYDQKHQ